MKTVLVVALLVAFAAAAEPQIVGPLDTRLVDALAELQTAKTRIAQLQVQVVEKDRQLAQVQYAAGKTHLELQRRLLEADAVAAECQLTVRASAAVEQLRVLEHPAAGLVYDMTSGRWVRPEKEKPQ